MNKIKYLALTLAGVFLLTMSCKDDKELVPVWETAVNGEGLIVSTAKDFKRGEPTVSLDFELKWISLDSKNTVTKIEVLLNWSESYTDSDGNPAVANHGTKTLTTFEGGSVPANHTPIAFNLTQAQIQALYAGATFDYKDGVSGNAIDVFGAPYNPARDATNIFIDKDAFTVQWHFTTDDGRVFDSWSPNVCTSLPGSNCQINFGVICAEQVPKASIAGNWVIDMQDTYGDGWQGGYISIVVDGAEVATAKISNGGCCTNKTGQFTYAASAVANTIEFVWSDDSYNSECVFSITSPKGNVVASVSTPSAGPIKLNLCQE